jgi:hypothetical protein
MAIPTPSKTANKHAQPIAEFRMDLKPPLTAKVPPVQNPARIALYGSSFFRIAFTVQSNVLNSPPQTPKLPPKTGALALTAVIAPIRLSP